MSFLCPNCIQKIDSASCPNECSKCRFQFDRLESIPVMLSEKDKKSPLFSDYIQNYDKIGQDDLNHGILDESYLNIQAGKMARYLGSLEGKVVCEVGIGRGYLFKELLKKKAAALWGIDICLSYLKRFQSEKVQLIIANAENLPFQESFDLIVASDILEHVFGPSNFLFSAYRALKPGGKLVVRVPYLEDLSQYSRWNGCPYDLVHLRNFSTETLDILVRGAGFKVRTHHYDGYMLLRSRLGGKLHHLITRPLRMIYGSKFGVAAIPNWIGRILMRPAEIIVVAQKS